MDELPAEVDSRTQRAALFSLQLARDPMIHRRTWATHREVKAAIAEWIEVFYNRHRIHSTLGYVSPADFETDARP